MVRPLGHCRLDVINSDLASPSRYDLSIFGTLPQSVQYRYLHQQLQVTSCEVLVVNDQVITGT